MTRSGPRVAVVGLGAMGSAVAYHLASRGAEVIGVEAYGPGHDRGASHGESRLIHQAYHADPAYVPLVLRAYELWRELEAECGERLLQVTGGLVLGAADSGLVRGALASSRRWGIRSRLMTASEVRREFPPLDPPRGVTALYEPDAGVLHPEAAVLCHLRGAAAKGAVLHFGERVVGWSATGDGVELRTSSGSLHVDRVVLAAGAWTADLVPEWNLPLEVERQLMVWLRPAAIKEFELGRFPAFLYQHDLEHAWYGFPTVDGRTVKVARHHGGEVTTADAVDWTYRQEEMAAVRDSVAEVVPGLRSAPVERARVGMYTNTPDGNFILGPHPDCERVLVACGFSGHGFRFSPVIGEVMADLVLEGDTNQPIGPLRADRLATLRP